MTNTHVLEDTFFDRFLGFAQRYDAATIREVKNGTSLTKSASKWIAEKDYESIYHYLKLYSHDSILSISHAELANMSKKELLALQDHSKAMIPLLAEEKALYAKVAGYLGKPVNPLNVF